MHVTQVVLKVEQLCNLNCTYCYVYNRGDDSWRSRPAVIASSVLQRLAFRIDEHCKRYGLDSFTVELHGGEPLLLGKRRMQELVDILRANCGAVRLRVILQTNGTLLDEEWLELFGRNGISFGISLDGPPEVADIRRVRLDGRGSTKKVLHNISRVRAYNPSLFKELFGGCLCVVNPDLDGARLVDWFAQQGIERLDFLLPDGNAVNLPQDWHGVEPYRKFLLEAFERWYEMGRQAPRIRMFELMMLGAMGQKAALDALGGDLRSLCIVESDGSIGVNDVARICGGDFSRDILNVFEHRLDQHADTYQLQTIQAPCQQCLQCPHFASCGGGYLPHRYDGLSFANPSLYCDALFALSQRMVDLLKLHLPATVWVTSELQSRGDSLR